MRGKGVAIANWLTNRTSGFFGSRLDRRSFIARATMLGTAMSVTGWGVLSRQGSAFTHALGGCSGGLCNDGYTEFCCVINQGSNVCPTNTIAAGWWRADFSSFCNGTRYYIDCNEKCCGPVRSDGFCAGCHSCRCADGCGTRRVYCNYFRYGQCNQGVAHIGPIACRMVTCVPPYQLNIGCSPSGAVDNSTAEHNANCAKYKPSAPAVPAPVGAAAVAGASRVAVVVRGTYGAGYGITRDSGSWAGFRKLGGYLTANPAAVGDSLGGVVALVRGQGRRTWWGRLDGSSWTGWQGLGGVLTTDPALTAAPGGQVWAFGAGTDAGGWFNHFNGTAWEGWKALHGTLTSTPAPVTDQAGNPAVFVRGSTKAVYMNRWTGSAWTGWRSLGGQSTSRIGACVDQTGALRVIVRGTNNAGYTGSVSGSTWSGWRNLGGVLASHPAAVVDQAGVVHFFVRGTNNAAYHGTLNGATWSGWSSLGGILTSSPSAVVDQAGSVMVFVRGTNNGLWVNSFNGTSWTGFTSLGGGIKPV